MRTKFLFLGMNLLLLVVMGHSSSKFKDGDNTYEFVLRVEDENNGSSEGGTISIANVNDFKPEIINWDRNGTR